MSRANDLLYAISNMGGDLVTEDCPECGRTVGLIWGDDDGLRAFCPHCGHKMMLCSLCDEHCDWHCDFNGNETCRMDKEVER